APESCFMQRFSKMKNLKYITADLESPLAEVKMNVQDIPFEDNTFDVVFCNHVMEHVDSDLEAMREIHRVLKPGGWAIMQVPMMKPGLKVTFEDASIVSPAERFKAFGQEDHVRLYGEDYGERLRLAGFQVKEDDFAAQLDRKVTQRHALPSREIIYFCEKA
ncbi:MAG: class I SAM-dependent methyltransferase, partial [Bacteroidota bacterium]